MAGWAFQFIWAVALFAGGCIGQSTIVVNVGDSGSFFQPSMVSAQTGDIVSFVFKQATHSVIQTAFESPCFPLKGGFSSGLVTRANDSVPTPVWNLKITNSSQPIWFYCGSTVPTSHCASGMVGGINIPTVDVYNVFVNYAKFASNPPTSIPVALAGQGAFATAAPQAPQPSQTPASSTSSSSTTTDSIMSSTPTSVASSSDSTQSHHKNLGAIIGGAVGGGVGALILILIAFLLFRRQERIKHRGSRDFFRYNAPTPDLSKANPAFVAARMMKEGEKEVLADKKDPALAMGYGSQSAAQGGKYTDKEKQKYRSPPESSQGHTNTTTAVSTPHSSSPTPLIAKNIQQGDVLEGKAKNKTQENDGVGTPSGSFGVGAGLAARFLPKKPEGSLKKPTSDQQVNGTKPAAAAFNFHNPAYHVPAYATKAQTQPPPQQSHTRSQSRSQPEQPRPQPQVPPPTQSTSRPRAQPQPQSLTFSPPSKPIVASASGDTKVPPRRVPAPTIAIPARAPSTARQPPLQEQDAGAVTNMDALARQVAAVLLERPTTLRPQPMGPRQPGESSRSSLATDIPAPPRYGAGAV